MSHDPNPKAEGARGTHGVVGHCAPAVCGPLVRSEHPGPSDGWSGAAGRALCAARPRAPESFLPPTSGGTSAPPPICVLSQAQKVWWGCIAPSVVFRSKIHSSARRLVRATFGELPASLLRSPHLAQQPGVRAGSFPVPGPAQGVIQGAVSLWEPGLHQTHA